MTFDVRAGCGDSRGAGGLRRDGAVMYPWVATHGETQARLSAHLEGELEGHEAKRVQRHLARCRVCQGVLRSLTRAVEGLRSLGEGEAVPPAPSVADAVVERIRTGDTRAP